MLLTNKMLQYYDHMVVIVLESRKFNCEDLTYFSLGHISVFDMENSQLRKENPYPPIPPPVKVKETEVITEEAMITTLKRALSFYSSIQAHDGHWPAESAGPLFFLQPFVCIFLTIVYKCMFILYFIFLSLRYKNACINCYTS